MIFALLTNISDSKNFWYHLQAETPSAAMMRRFVFRTAVSIFRRPRAPASYAQPSALAESRLLSSSAAARNAPCPATLTHSAIQFMLASAKSFVDR